MSQCLTHHPWRTNVKSTTWTCDYFAVLGIMTKEIDIKSAEGQPVQGACLDLCNTSDVQIKRFSYDSRVVLSVHFPAVLVFKAQPVGPSDGITPARTSRSFG